MTFSYVDVGFPSVRAQELAKCSIALPRKHVDQAASTALQAADRMRTRNLATAVDEVVSAVRAHNARWRLLPFLWKSEDRALLTGQILAQGILHGDSWFDINMPARHLAFSARAALVTPAQADGRVHLSMDVWAQLEVYAPRRERRYDAPAAETSNNSDV